MSVIVKGDPKTGKRVVKLPDGEEPRLMTAPPKTGRLASLAERERAQDLVDQFEIDLDPEVLVRALRHFAAEGTFAETVDMRPATARTMARWMKTATFDEKVQAVVEHFHVSEPTAARWLRKPQVSPRDTD